MAERFMKTVLTPSVLAAQEHYYRRHASIGSAPERDPLTEEERAFIEARDSFYMATITESGWPYIQHRGGQRGFLRVVSPTQLAFADYKGNRQMLPPAISPRTAGPGIKSDLVDGPAALRAAFSQHDARVGSSL
jgi:hypothetical protein